MEFPRLHPLSISGFSNEIKFTLTALYGDGIESAYISQNINSNFVLFQDNAGEPVMEYRLNENRMYRRVMVDGVPTMVPEEDYIRQLIREEYATMVAMPRVDRPFV
jgi:hypothetical protein